MKRSGPIARRTPLKAKAPARRSELPQKRIRAKVRGPRTKARNRCDRLWSELIRWRDGACRSCSVGPEQRRLEAAHIVPRRFFGVRWCFTNGLTLCNPCHSRYTMSEAAWYVFVADLLGVETWDALHRIANAKVGQWIDYTEVERRLVDSRALMLQDA